MAKTLTTTIKLQVNATLAESLDLGNRSFPMSYRQTWTLASGVAANQADLLFQDTRTLAASATENLDLAGVLTDPLGATLTYVRVKAIIVKAAAGNTNNVILGGDATATFLSWVGAETDSVIIRPGGAIMLVAPDATAYVAAATTADLLMVTNSAGSTEVTYDIIIIGASA